MTTIKTDRLYWIDWLRFLASFIVVLCHLRSSHYVEYGSLESNSKNTFIFMFFASTRLGYEAVVMFFALSGILVGGKLIEKSMSEKLIISNYFIDRFFRIYVPYVPILVLSGLVSVEKIDFKNLSINLLGLQGIFGVVFSGNNSLWTLSYEIWFYVLAGSMSSLVFLNSKKTFKSLQIIAFFIAVSLYTKLDSTFLFCFIIGSVLNFLKINTKYSRTALIYSLLFSILLAILSQLASDSISLNYDFYKQFLPTRKNATILMCFSFCVLIKSLSCSIPSNTLYCAIEKLGSNLASFSYTLYLCHLPVIYFLSSTTLFPSDKFDVVSPYSVYLFILKLIIVIFVSIVLYFAFERNTLYLKNKFKLLFTYKYNSL